MEKGEKHNQDEFIIDFNNFKQSNCIHKIYLYPVTWRNTQGCESNVLGLLPQLLCHCSLSVFPWSLCLISWESNTITNTFWHCLQEEKSYSQCYSHSPLLHITSAKCPIWPWIADSIQELLLNTEISQKFFTILHSSSLPMAHGIGTVYCALIPT